MLVGGVIVEDGVGSLSGWNLALDGLQEADEFLMAMALHVVAMNWRHELTRIRPAAAALL